MGLAGFVYEQGSGGAHRGGVILPSMLPNDLKELVLYLTMLFIVMSWMLREIHLAFFAATMDSRQSTEPGARSSEAPTPMVHVESYVVPVPVQGMGI